MTPQTTSPRSVLWQLILIHWTIELLEQIRDYSNFNANRFLSELQETEWSNLSDNDANKWFTTFLQKNKLLGKQACPNENSLQAQGKNIVKTMDYQRNENFNTNKNNLF